MCQVRAGIRGLSTDMKMKDSAAVAANIKYFKIYRYDPEQDQKDYIM